MRPEPTCQRKKESASTWAVGLSARASRYLNEKFPPVQVFALAMAMAVVYLACARLAMASSAWGWAGATAAVTGTLYFLQVRLLDDFDAHYTNLVEITHVTPHGLLVGVGLTTIPIVLLNADGDIIGYALLPTAVMVGASIVIALWCPLRTSKPLTSWRPHIVALLLGRIPLFDVGPGLALFYVSVKWEVSRGISVRPGSIWLVVGVIWVLYEIWKVSRNIGRYEGYDYIYRPYGVSWTLQRIIVACLALCSIALNIAFYLQANLSIAYLVYTVSLNIILIVLALARLRDGRRPWWRGLTFPALMVIGLLVQFIALT